MDGKQELPEASIEVVETAKKAAEATEASRVADTASLLEQVDMHMAYALQKTKLEMHDSLVEIVGDALGKTPTRYFDATRIPLICQAILTIDENMKELKNMIKEDRENSEKEQKEFVRKDGDYKIIRALVFSGVAITMTTLLGAILSTYIK